MVRTAQIVIAATDATSIAAWITALCRGRIIAQKQLILTHHSSIDLKGKELE
jgi:hypothetical protein